jgi:hypothetical protein
MKELEAEKTRAEIPTAASKIQSELADLGGTGGASFSLAGTESSFGGGGSVETGRWRNDM